MGLIMSVVPNPNLSSLSKKLIQRDFLTTPIRFIDKIFQEHNHLYAAYLAIDLAEQTYDSSKPKPYAKLKKLRRRGGHPSYSSSDTPGPSAAPFTVAADADHMAMELQMELQAARLQRQKLQIQRQIQKDAAAAEAAQEQEHRDNGDVLECQCCFDDDVPINKITHCDGDDNHFFCFSCAQNNASNEIGLGRHQLLCMDGSGCKAHFSPAERRRFLEPKLLEKLERSEQQAQLKEANLENLDSCPFCDFAAICSPKDIDREFRCQNPECELVSCRLCRSSTHIPMSCEEYQKENGHSKRHEVEESMSAAVIRQCPRCKTATIKEEGCNKVSCTCGAMICDFCGKDITKEGYNHFSDGARGLRLSDAKKCPTYDDTHARNEKRVDQAEKGALEKVRLENPNLSEEDLKIKFSGSVQKRVGGRGAERFERDYQRIRGRGPPPPLPPFPHFILDRPYRHGVLANHALDNNAQHAALGQPNAMVEGIAYGENERRIGRMIDQRTQELQQRLQEQLEQSLEQQRQRQELQQQQHLQLQQQQARHRQYIHQQQARQAEVRAEKLAGQREREIALPYMPEWRRAREQGARDERGRYHHPLPWGYGNILGQDEGLFVGEGEGGGVPPYEPMIRRPWE